MRFTRRRTDRHNAALGQAGSGLEALESRQLLSGPGINLSYYIPSDFPAQAVHPVALPPIAGFHPTSSNARQLSFLDNDGKVLTGKDRQGDEWSITVHGPGAVIVTDATPNDGILDDDIDTIQLVGTDIHSTFVTGEVTASARLVTDGIVFFNHLIASSGVASIILNGFTLTQNIPPPASLPPGAIPAIFLPGGVQFLQFHNIENVTDLAGTPVPINIVIGDPTTPLAVQPQIRLDSIFNTVINSTGTLNPSLPQVEGTVNILVNGQLRGLDMISSTAAPIPAAFQFQFPTVATTGRTAIRATAVGHLNVVGSAKNLTVSRRAIPFQNGFSGVDSIGSATFGGTADAVGLDVNGPIGHLAFARGLGDPSGVTQSATAFGTPVATLGYPANGLLGGLISAQHIGSLVVGPANFDLQTANNPDFVQLRRTGTTTFYTRAGNALTNVAIVSSGSIGKTTIVGHLRQSEIKSGFHYPSFVAGLEGTRAPSKIGPVTHRGDLIDSVISATVRPNDHIYGNLNDTFGPGTIRGHSNARLFQTGAATPLNNLGAGFFARKKIGVLPPPQAPKRINGVLVEP